MTSCPRCGRLNPADAVECERCAEPLERVVPIIAAGQVLDGRYRIDEFLGAGGMGQVFAATELLLERPVALKILNAELLRHATARERMEREAKALARVQHQNVIRINTMFKHEGMLVLDLELVTGGTLSSRLQSGAIPSAEALRIFAGVLAGLGALHAAKLVHRDLKPGNILITEDGVPKIADLGIAHDVGGRRVTRTGAHVGTPEYMSPEQIRGETVDARSDVYACGIMLYEMLSGDVPFKGKSDFDVQAAHVSQRPDLARLELHAPTHIVSCIERALEKEPDRRWPSAAAFAEGLTRGPPSASPALEPVRKVYTEPPVVLEAPAAVPSADGVVGSASSEPRQRKRATRADRGADVGARGTTVGEVVEEPTVWTFVCEGCSARLAPVTRTRKGARAYVRSNRWTLLGGDRLRCAACSTWSFSCAECGARLASVTGTREEAEAHVLEHKWRLRPGDKLQCVDCRKGRPRSASAAVANRQPDYGWVYLVVTLILPLVIWALLMMNSK